MDHGEDSRRRGFATSDGSADDPNLAAHARSYSTPVAEADAAADDGVRPTRGPLLRQRRGVDLIHGRLCWMVLHDAAAMLRRVSR